MWLPGDRLKSGIGFEPMTSSLKILSEKVGALLNDAPDIRQKHATHDRRNCPGELDRLFPE